LDLRGVTISARRWAAVGRALYREPGELDLRSAQLENATFGPHSDLADAMFGRSANLNGVVFGAQAVLTRARFDRGTSLTFATFGDGVDLSEATFGHDVDLAAARFGRFVALGGASFGDRASFSRARFAGDVFAAGTSFGDRVSFEFAAFGGRSIFARCSFGEHANLQNVGFVGSVAFHHTTFGSSTQMAGLVCESDLGLRNAVFNGQQRLLGSYRVAGRLDLREARFDGEMRLRAAADVLDLTEAAFDGPATIGIARAQVWATDARFAGQATLAALEGAPRALLRSVQGVDVASLTVIGVNVTKARFAGAQNLNKIRLIDTEFDKVDGRQRLYEERCLTDPQTLEPDEASHQKGLVGSGPDQVAELYRLLRKGREDSSDAPGGNDLYIGEQLMRRRALKRVDPKDLGVHGRLLILGLYGMVAGFGVRPLRPVAAFTIVFALAWATALFGNMIAPKVAAQQHEVTPWVVPVVAAGSVSVPAASAQPRPPSPSVAERSGPAAVYVIRSLLLLPTSGNVETTTEGDALQAALRLLGPLLLGFVALGLRAQVKR
jgi:hypothetical protein